MSTRPQIHVFVGAPRVPSQLEVSECSRSVLAGEKWRELHFLCDGHGLFSAKCRSTDHLMCQGKGSTVLAVPPNVYCSQKSKQRDLRIAKEGCMSPVTLAETSGTATRKTGSVMVLDYESSKDGSTNVKQTADQHHLQKSEKSDEQDEKPLDGCSNLTGGQGQVSRLEVKCSDISDLVTSTKEISIHLRSVGQDIPSAHIRNCHEALSQYLDMCFPSNQDSKPKGENDCSNLEVSTDTEFRSVMTSSQMAVLAQGGTKMQNEMQKRTVKLLETEAENKHKERQYEHFSLNPNVRTSHAVAENACEQEYTGSLELFDSESDSKSCFDAIKREGSAHENTEASEEQLNVPVEQLVNEIHIEPLSSGILCSQVSSSCKSFFKRAPKSEESLHVSNSPFKRQMKSKRVKLNSSLADPEITMDEERMTEMKKIQKHLLSLLKNCCCKNQKYNVLVAIVHPCHIKEIQMKRRPKSSCKVPVATIVVTDQSRIERKVVLWRAAAFWSLTVFPGDIVLLTDITVYENLWFGEIMLQSTCTSQLLNLGNCSALNPKQFHHIGDVGVLHALLAYVSSEFSHFGDLPFRQVQRLDNVQHVPLDQLQSNTLVHSVLKIISITVLTESVYNYQGGSERKVILTVEQKRDQHYRMVLWGAGAAWCPQLQMKKEHIWEFKYLLVRHSSVSGDFELHTTPWSSCECLFDDDKRAIEFKEKFLKSKTSLLKMTNLSAHLEEKCSGVIQLKARILELKFTISTGQYRQLIFNANTSLESVVASLPMITYSGCAKCGAELEADENKIYKQCVRCLPYNKVKTFYRNYDAGHGVDTIKYAPQIKVEKLILKCTRSALMTIEDGGYEIYVHVVSELMEKIFLNIPADWLNRAVVPSSGMTYRVIVAELCHLLLADMEASYVLEIRSHFVLDENSYPLQKDFHLLDFHPDL